MKPSNFASAAALLLIFVSPSLVSAQSPGWSPVVVARGEYRYQIKSLPIEQRPNRPFHFYGNSIRRRHYRGVTTPLPRVYSAPSMSFVAPWRY